MEFFQKSETLDYILNKRLSFLLHHGMLILFSMALIGIAATYFVFIPDTVSGQFELSNTNPPKAVVANTGGRIIQLNTRDKSSVKKDAVVAVIEALADTAEVNKLDRQLSAFDSMQDSDFFDNMINSTFNNYDHLGELQNQFEQFKKAKNELTFTWSEKSYFPEREIAERRLDALKAQLENEKNQLAIYQRDFEIANENFNNTQQLYEKNVVSRNELKQAESTKLSKELLVSQLKSQLIATANGDNDVQEQVIQMYSRVETQKNNLLQNFSELKGALEGWKKDHFLRAPETGTISYVHPVHENETVLAGAILFYLVPGESEIIGNLKVNQTNFGKVKPGLPVKIKLDGYNYQEVGIINGTVSSIADIPIDNFYLVEIKFPNGLITSHGKPIQFKYGLTGTADITLQKRRLLDKLFIDNFRGNI